MGLFYQNIDLTIDVYAISGILKLGNMLGQKKYLPALVSFEATGHVVGISVVVGTSVTSSQD